MTTPDNIQRSPAPDPMLIRPAAASSAMAAIERAHRKGKADDGCPMPEVEPCEDDCPEEIEAGVGRLAVVKISGVLARNVSGYEWLGLCDYADVAEEICEAEDDSNVSGIVLVIDSPGGEVIGCAELADAIAACEKPVLAFSEGLMCSAAYWIASAASMVATTKSARSGSIGAYVAIADISAMYAAMGVTMEVFASGAQKGAGYPGTSLTDEQRAEIAATIERIASGFQSFVSENRPAVDTVLFDGRDVDGAQAVEMGISDLVAANLDDAVEAFTALYL